MKNYYVVCDGEVYKVNHADLNSYPFAEDNEAYKRDTDGERRLFYITAGKEWVMVYADTPEEAKELAGKYDRGELDMGNVWCPACGVSHWAVFSPERL